MSFERNTEDEKRIEHKNGGNSTYEFPQGNYFAGMHFDMNIDIDLATAVAVTVLPEQVARMIEELIIMRDGNNVAWQISGEMLARLFKKNKNGVEAASNTTMSVAVANGKTARCSFYIPFSILGAPKASDAAMDTNAHKYELKIKWRDLTASGTLFADTSSSAITINAAGTYIDLELDKITPVTGPDGKADSYSLKRPFFPSLMEQQDTITQTKSDYRIELPENKVVHNLVLFTNTESTANAWTGSNSILTGNLNLRNTQGRSIQNRKASTVRERTSQDLNLGSNIEDGLYHFPITQHGNIVDSLVSDGTKPLYVRADVAKLANETRITTIVQTIEQQGGV